MASSLRPLSHSFLLILLVHFVLLGANQKERSQQSSKQDADWAEIEKLYAQGWNQREQLKFSESQKTFRSAVKKLTRYRRDYIKNSHSLSYIRASYLLGTFSELSDNDQSALIFYQEVLDSPPGGSVREAAEIHLLSQQAAKRILISKDRLDRQRSSKDLPRVSARGGSKGSKNLPDRESLLQP